MSVNWLTLVNPGDPVCVKSRNGTSAVLHVLDVTSDYIVLEGARKFGKSGFELGWRGAAAMSCGPAWLELPTR